jgi:hypothetical protein
MRHVLALFDYPNKDDELVGSPDNKIIGPPDLLSERKFTAPFPPL